MTRLHSTVLRCGLLATLVAGAASCAAAPPPQGSSPGGRSSGAPSASPSSTQQHLLEGKVGFAGAAGWTLSPTGLAVSEDGGTQWSAVSLPAGVMASLIVAVAHRAAGPLWIAVTDGQGVDLYRRLDPAGQWSSTRLLPSWPAVAAWNGPPDTVSITPGPAGLVTVVTSLRVGMSSGFSSLFVSSDAGATFEQHPAPSESEVNVVWWSATLVTPQSGVVVAGPTQEQLFHTSDGGTSWSAASGAGLPAVGTYGLGTPVVVGADLELPITSEMSDGSETFSLFISHDGGATFSDTGGSAVHVAPDYNAPAISDSLGQVTWVVPPSGGTIFESTNQGRTWTTVAATGLSEGVLRISLTSPVSATAVMVSSSCTGYKTGCQSQGYLMGTTDGGRTWHNL